MKYDLEYLKFKNVLIKIFLLNASQAILDISYQKTNKNVILQIVLLKDNFLSEKITEELVKNMPEVIFEIRQIYISKEQFNETRGEWQPKYYSWLDDVLFSKAEII